MLPGLAVGPWRGCSLGCWKEAPPGPRAVDPGQDPSAVPVSELQRWAEASWPGPGPQNQLPELTTGTGRGRNHQSLCVWVHLHVTDERNVSNQNKYFHYQSSMSVACAAGGAAAGGGLLLLLLRWLVVVVGVGEDQTLRGRGRRWFSSSANRLLQQRGEVQTVVQYRQLERACRSQQLPM